MRYARIASTGIYVPDRVVTNAELGRALGEDVEDFVSSVIGIRERHFCAETETTADLATRAGARALAEAGLAVDDVDLIIVATDTPEYISPSTSVVVQDRLGARRAGTFDVNAACAGFVTALDAAAKYVVADPDYRNVLVVGAYAMSKYIDWSDKKTSTIFADGAGAVVLQASARPGVLASRLVADGSYHDFLGIHAGGTFMPITEAVLAEGRYNKVRFHKKYPPAVNIEGWPAIVREVLDRCALDVRSVDLFLFTQVNLSTIREVVARLEVPANRAHTVMHKWGYTGSACIPMALDDAVRAGKLGPGSVVVMCASGGGLNMACLAYRW